MSGVVIPAELQKNDFLRAQNKELLVRALGSYLRKLMSKAKPLLLDENLKAMNCSIVGVEHKHRQSRQLKTVKDGQARAKQHVA